MDIIKKYILKDMKLKLLSLVLASMLWLAVSYMGESKMSIFVHVSTENLSRDLIVRKMDTEEVLVAIEGPISILKGIRARDVGISLDLSDAREGNHVYTLEKNHVRAPKGIKVQEVKPDYIVVEIDGIVEKKLKTIVKLDKKWAGMYSIKSWDPLYVRVQGSRLSLEGKDFIEALPVDGSFLLDEETIDVPLDTKNMVIKKIKPDAVKVILRRR